MWITILGKALNFVKIKIQMSKMSFCCYSEGGYMLDQKVINISKRQIIYLSKILKLYLNWWNIIK